MEHLEDREGQGIKNPTIKIFNFCSREESCLKFNAQEGQVLQGYQMLTGMRGIRLHCETSGLKKATLVQNIPPNSSVKKGTQHIENCELTPWERCGESVQHERMG
jgi:hypothetical protein